MDNALLILTNVQNVHEYIGLFFKKLMTIFGGFFRNAYWETTNFVYDQCYCIALVKNANYISINHDIVENCMDLFEIALFELMSTVEPDGKMRCAC